MKKHKTNKGKPLCLVIVGPNGSGKSKLAVQLALAFQGEIISADSRQVFKGCTIATGKIPRAARKGIPHHCLDVADPTRQYSVARFIKDSSHAMQDIAARKRTPIVCGGTGFWIDALVRGLVFPQVHPDASLRRKLSRLSAAKLFQKLRRKDPFRAKTIDRHNPRRLIRALEIVEKLGRPVPQVIATNPYRALWLGIGVPKERLQRLIHRRVAERLSQGMISEARRLHKRGVSYRRMRELGLEYRVLADYLTGKLDKKMLARRIEYEDMQYAKRQMTWLKRNPDTHWVRSPAEAKRLVKQFLKQE